jgi:hypothetical protein
MNTRGFDAYQARWWNQSLPNAEQFTKEEYKNTKDFNAFEALWWNQSLPNSEQFTEEEIDNLAK